MSDEEGRSLHLLEHRRGLWTARRSLSRRFLDVAMGLAANWSETILSFDLAFIAEAVQEETLDTLIQIKRMLGGLLSRLGWGRTPSASRQSVDPLDGPRRKADG